MSLVAISSFFISCLDSDVTYSNNPHVATFSIQSDTLVPGIENTVFTVDTLSKKSIAIIWKKHKKNRLDVKKATFVETL